MGVAGLAPSVLTQYVYNQDNRLTGIALPSGASNAFEYDATGLRTKKTDSYGTTRYLLDGLSVIALYAPDVSNSPANATDPFGLYAIGAPVTTVRMYAWLYPIAFLMLLADRSPSTAVDHVKGGNTVPGMSPYVSTTLSLGVAFDKYANTSYTPPNPGDRATGRHGLLLQHGLHDS